MKVHQVARTLPPPGVSSPGSAAVGTVLPALPGDSFSRGANPTYEPRRLALADIDDDDEPEIAPPLTDSPQPVCSLQSVAEINPIKTFQAPLSRQDTSAALTLKLLLKRQADKISPELGEKLQSDPLLVGTLCGVTPGASLKLSPEDAAQLRVLADSMELSTRRPLAVLSDPLHPGNTLLLDRHRVGYMAPELSWGIRKVPRLMGNWTPEVVQKLQESCDEQRPEAVSCLALLRTPPAQRLPAPTTPQKIGMIAYVNSDYQLQRFGEVVQEWKSNLTEFGHHHLQFTVCDDSPEPYGTKMRTMLQEASQDSPVRFRYLGAAEKTSLKSKVEEALAASVGPAEASRVAELVAGAGATQNRNLSLQLLGKSGGLQIDHDMTAEVLGEVSDKPIAYDIVGYLEREAPQGGGLASFRFCGAYDCSIDSIAAQDLPPLQSQAWNGPENRQPVAPQKVQGLMDEGMGNLLRAPMFVPGGADPAMRIAPGLRDGDIALDTFSQKISGLASTELGHYVHHRDEAGSRWGAAKLMSQYLLYDLVNKSVTDWLPGEKYSPRQAGEAILNKLNSPDPWPNFSSVWAYADYKKVATDFVQRRESGLSGVHEMTEKLPSDEGSSVVQQWLGQSLTPENRDVCQQQLQDLQRKLRSDRDEMKQAMHIGPDGQVDSQALQSDMQRQAAQVLRTQALALIHADKIAEVLIGAADKF